MLAHTTTAVPPRVRRQRQVNAPVFLISMGRTGSTIVFEALAAHEQLAWFSSYNARFPTADWVSVLHRVYDLPLLQRLPRSEKRQHRQGQARSSRFLPKPSECYRKWTRLCGREFPRHFLLGVDATEDQRQDVRQAIGRALFWQGKSRFLAKFTGPSRIRFLLSIFPDARFVHLTRDPRAVVRSGIEFYRRLGDPEALREPPWPHGFPGDWREEWSRYGHDLVAGAALCLRALRRALDMEKGLLHPDQLLELGYADFISGPAAAMEHIFEFCRLSRSERVLRRVSTPGRYRNMDYKAAQDLSKDQIDLIDRILAS